MLLTIEPTPVVRVNHAVAPAEDGRVDVAMSLLFELQKSLPDFQPFHAAHAAVLAQAGEKDGALGAYAKAIELASNDSDRLFLAGRAKRLGMILVLRSVNEVTNEIDAFDRQARRGF